MTVCIAAGASHEKDKALVLCTDWRVSSPLGSAETKLKQILLRDSWWCLTSGKESDIAAVVKLLTRKMDSTQTIDETNIVGIVRDALNARKKEKTNELIQGRYAISYDDFLSFGKDKLPADIHREAIMAIADLDLGCSLIVAGFDGAWPFIMETNERCRVFVREDFAVIGEGTFLAQSALFQRELMDAIRLPETIYCVYEAKKYAERVNSVGPVTTITIVFSDGSTKDVSDERIEYLARCYARLGPQKMYGQVSKITEYLL
jgi:20S proteasome alpha/beta subunit